MKKEFNEKLIEEETESTIIEYVKELNKEFFKIDITFIDDLIELIGKNECCIHQDMLLKYGVLTDIHTSNNVKRLLDKICVIKLINIDIFSNHNFHINF